MTGGSGYSEVSKNLDGNINQIVFVRSQMFIVGSSKAEYILWRYPHLTCLQHHWSTDPILHSLLPYSGDSSIADTRLLMSNFMRLYFKHVLSFPLLFAV